MNKTELIEALAERLGDKKTAAAAVDGLVDVVVRSVHKGEKVTITGFGVFEKRARAARMARNPRTGEAVRVKKTTVPAFRAGTNFKEVVSGAKKLPRATSSAQQTKQATGRHGSQAGGASSSRAAASRAATSRATGGSAATRTAAARSTAAKSAGSAKTSPAKTGAAKASPAKTGAAKTGAAKTSPAKTSPAKTGAAKTGAAKTSPAKAPARSATRANTKPASSGARKAVKKSGNK